MPVQVSYPGVYVQEEPSGVQTITGVSTSIALFVGMARARRPWTARRNLLSFSDYERTFGSDTTVSETTDQVRQFFINGGTQAYVIRIAGRRRPGGIRATSTTRPAQRPGRDGEGGGRPRASGVEVNYATAAAREAPSISWSSREIIDASGEPTLVETETLRRSVDEPERGAVRANVVEPGSRLISLPTSGRGPGFAGYSMSGRARGRLACRDRGDASRTQATPVASDQCRTAAHRPVLLTGRSRAIGDIQTAINTARERASSATVAAASTAAIAICWSLRTTPPTGTHGPELNRRRRRLSPGRCISAPPTAVSRSTAMPPAPAGADRPFRQPAPSWTATPLANLADPGCRPRVDSVTVNGTTLTGIDRHHRCRRSDDPGARRARRLHPQQPAGEASAAGAAVATLSPDATPNFAWAMSLQGFAAGAQADLRSLPTAASAVGGGHRAG